MGRWNCLCKFAPEMPTRDDVGQCNESICIGSAYKNRQFLFQGTVLLMPLYYAYMIIFIFEWHRIRFSLVLSWKGVWRYL